LSGQFLVLLLEWKLFVDTMTLWPGNYQMKLQWTAVVGCCQCCKIRRSIREVGTAYKTAVYIPAPHESRHHRHCWAWS